MLWWLFLLLLGWSAVASFLLMADRVLDVDSKVVIRRAGIPLAVASVLLLGVTALVEPGYVELVGWGALAGLLGTIALDVVRLIGVRAGAFPLDMPVVFGFMALGRARMLQSHVMGEALRGAVESGTVKEFVWERVSRIPHLPNRQRSNVVAAMAGALATLDPVTRNEVAEAQFAALGSLTSGDRQVVMAAMDNAGASARPGQPRGVPRIPFSVFRNAASRAIERLDRSEEALMRRVRAAGYLWHALNGVSFGIGYALLLGQGSLAWAVAWGVFVWAAMMIAMPSMMPVLELPRWFPVVPLVAHLAMIIPYLALTTWVSRAAHEVSLLGWLTG